MPLRIDTLADTTVLDELLDTAFHGSTFGRCPRCRSSFVCHQNTATSGVWLRCQGCDLRGSGVEILAAVRETGLVEAIREISKLRDVTLTVKEVQSWLDRHESHAAWNRLIDRSLLRNDVFDRTLRAFGIRGLDNLVGRIGVIDRETLRRAGIKVAAKSDPHLLLVPLEEIPGNRSGFVIPTLSAEQQRPGPIVAFGEFPGQIRGCAFADVPARFLWLDPIEAFRMQGNRLIDRKTPLNLRTSLPGIEPDSLPIFEENPVIWTPLINGSVLALARKLNASLVTKKQTDAWPVASRLEVERRLQRAATDAVPWADVLDQELAQRSPEEARRLLTEMERHGLAKEEWLSGAPSKVRMRVEQEPDPTTEVVLFLGRALEANSAGWRDSKTKERLSNVLLELDEIRRYRDVVLLLGTVKTEQGSVPFYVEEKFFLDDPARVLETLIEPLGKTLFVQTGWLTRLLDLSKARREPLVRTSTEPFVGFNKETKTIRYPGFEWKPTVIEPKSAPLPLWSRPVWNPPGGWLGGSVVGSADRQEKTTENWLFWALLLTLRDQAEAVLRGNEPFGLLLPENWLDKELASLLGLEIRDTDSPEVRLAEAAGFPVILSRLPTKEKTTDRTSWWYGRRTVLVGCSALTRLTAVLADTASWRVLFTDNLNTQLTIEDKSAFCSDLVSTLFGKAKSDGCLGEPLHFRNRAYRDGSDAVGIRRSLMELVDWLLLHGKLTVVPERLFDPRRNQIPRTSHGCLGISTAILNRALAGYDHVFDLDHEHIVDTLFHDKDVHGECTIKGIRTLLVDENQIRNRLSVHGIA